MYKGDRKYISIDDDDGEIIGYIDDYQPNSADLVFITIIAIKPPGPNSQWNTEHRDIEIGVDLSKSNEKWKFYDDYEEFFNEFFDALL